MTALSTLSNQDNKTYNILMYSHDTYGLGHIRRTMAIANHLRDKNTNVLILTGSPLAGRFKFPEQVDFVRIPGMIKHTNDEYKSLSIKIDEKQALSIRTNIILATAQTFRPHLFIVDKEPLGLKKEVLPTLNWFKNESPETKTVLGLRDILDDSTVIQEDWKEKNVYSYLDELYGEIWVYGNQEIYDPIEMYNIPASIHDRVKFTGYIPRKTLSNKDKKAVRRRYRIMEDDKFVLVTTGGGGDGFEMINHFLEMHDYYPSSLPFKSIIITGPFMPKKAREHLKKRANKFGIKVLPFHPRMEELMGAADLVISMGGYNTICEILTQQTPALIIPREYPRKEQLIRAERLKKQGLLDFIPWKEVTPQNLREKVFDLINQQDAYVKSINSFELSGLDTMLARLTAFKNIEAIPAQTETITQLEPFACL
ncbi:glycosyltransferase family protein [Desulforhopalus sp. IMCC35007]|uniref:glycosyltransferase family protein n=1 Tax=Desulforhopalus sp. IMCC35007 TaxID=2569543 RepID=UPI0010ADEF67|nr:glycosyltransferase [Desulforhopalus sp. IMCC35007]TKB06332.1 glycosyltransferase [Desulforhopalus sp. IMCC35007]